MFSFTMTAAPYVIQLPATTSKCAAVNLWRSAFLRLHLPHSFSSSNGPSTCQLWTQRSIGASARKDLARFAALQNMAQLHSNSSTPDPWFGERWQRT